MRLCSFSVVPSSCVWLQSLLPRDCHLGDLVTGGSHLIQQRAGALHKKTLLSHVSNIDAHMVQKTSQVLRALFQYRSLKQD